MWKFSRNDHKHFYLIFIALLLSASILAMPNAEFKQLFFEEAEELSAWSTINAAWFFAMLLLWLASSSVYFYRLLKRTHSYRVKLREAFTEFEHKKLTWVIVFMALLFATWFYAALVVILGDSQPFFLISETAVAMLFSLIVWLFCLNAIHQQPEFVKIGFKPKGSYEFSGLDEERLQSISDEIEKAVKKKKVYLDPSLNAVTLSQKLRVSTQNLSETFSKKMNTTFYDYINTVRIESAKIELVETDKTVLAIALDSGFNTRSSFYNAFKKNTGITPTAYRKKFAH